MFYFRHTATNWSNLVNSGTVDVLITRTCVIVHFIIQHFIHMDIPKNGESSRSPEAKAALILPEWDGSCIHGPY